MGRLGEGTDQCNCSLQGRWLSLGLCPERLLLPEPLAFQEPLSRNWGREGSRMYGNAQCIMGDAVIGVPTAGVMRMRTAADGSIDVECLLSLYALVP